MRELLFDFNRVMLEHGLTIEQTYTILCMANSIEVTPSAEMYPIFISKRLLNADGVNVKVLYRGREEVVQQELPLTVINEPKGGPVSLKIADNIELLVVPEKERTTEVIKNIADDYFKGDIKCAKYYNIFKWCFPRKSHTLWNKVFKITYDGSSRWDSSARVAKNFQKIYLKKDIGAFLWGLISKIEDVTDTESGECYITKPNKFLQDYSEWYEKALEKIKVKENGGK